MNSNLTCTPRATSQSQRGGLKAFLETNGILDQAGKPPTWGRKLVSTCLRVRVAFGQGWGRLCKPISPKQWPSGLSSGLPGFRLSYGADFRPVPICPPHKLATPFLL